ncbi:MAG: GIY-YIG nuclease family protein [archaeon]
MLSLNSGAYLLILYNKRNQNLKIGKNHSFLFPKGFLVYVGSAMNSLDKRIARHLKKQKKLFWHIDFLTTNKNIEVIQVLAFPSKKRSECNLNSKVKALSDSSFAGFGCSDCKCNAHLHFFIENPLNSFKQAPFL